MKARKRTASTPYSILGLLAIEPMSGYDIHRAANETIGHFWSESFGQIYPTLARLAKDGLVRRVADATPARAGRRRTTYATTARGRAALAAWRKRPPVLQPPRSELLLKVFFCDPRRAQDVLLHVRAARAFEQARRATYRVWRGRIRREAADHPSRDAWLATLRYGELHARAVIQWCDETLRAFAAAS